jgi:predicted  nucleic acid-binding Zn-ribbon protein
MPNDRALGDHLGYLAYHVEALQRRDADLERELAKIDRDTNSKDEQIRKERAALKDYRSDVRARLTKLDEQAENCFEDATDTTRERAFEIRDSAVSTHLDETEVPDAEFQSASDL